MNKKGVSIILILTIAIVLVVISISFFMMWGGKISDEKGVVRENKTLGDKGVTSREINCGEVPRSFFQNDIDKPPKDPDAYFQENPKVKKSLECFSTNFRDCKNAKIDYLKQDPFSGNFVLYVKSEDDKCTVIGRFSVRELVRETKCNFTKEQTKDYYQRIIELRGMEDVSEDSWIVTFTLALNYIFRLNLEEEKIEKKFIFELSPGISCERYDLL